MSWVNLKIFLTALPHPSHPILTPPLPMLLLLCAPAGTHKHPSQGITPFLPPGALSSSSLYVPPDAAGMAASQAPSPPAPEASSSSSSSSNSTMAAAPKLLITIPVLSAPAPAPAPAGAAAEPLLAPPPLQEAQQVAEQPAALPSSQSKRIYPPQPQASPPTSGDHTDLI